VVPSNRGERPVSSRTPRADAVRNRARVLDAARAAFTAEGPDVPLDEIARRAGVGAGTVHRHFPTKAALVDAVLATSVSDLAARAQGLDDADDPVAAFFDFLRELVASGAAAHDLADRLRPSAGDLDAALREPVADLDAALAGLLARAQLAGGVRTDVDAADLAAVVAAAHAAHVHRHGGAAAVRLVLDGLRPR
jgi:AcrR family transcriptional regulator